MSMHGVYSAGFVVGVVVNGKLQEVSVDNIISLKFNSEYKLRLQNKNSRRAVAKIFVDNENVSEGGVIIGANSTVEVEGPVYKNFNFKFVSLDSGQAADAGKSVNRNGEKGVIRVEFKLEKEYKKPAYTPRTWQYPVENFATFSSNHYDDRAKCDGVLENKTCGSATKSGATVSGERNSQSWNESYIDLEYGEPVILSVTLRGWSEADIPLVDGSDVYCSSCGKKAKSKTDKFCSRCGNKLH